MKNEIFKLEIVNPESSFLLKDNISEVIVPSFEGEMGILKDHISIISFLKPGLIRVFESGASQVTYYVEDGILEFKDNCLSILTSKIFDITKIDQNFINDNLNQAENETQNVDLSDQEKYLIEQKIDVLKSLKLN